MQLPAVAELPILTWSRARSVGYLLEYVMLHRVAAMLPGGRRSKGAKGAKDATTSPAAVKLIKEELNRLLERDARNIVWGIYPISVLKPESPLKHAMRLPRLVADGLRLQLRRARGRTTEFSREARESLDELPRYYRRNFHFQTDGYLTDQSARLYDHQVEILFTGAADAMRRLIIEPMRAALGSQGGKGGKDGKGLRILEIGAGVGSATRFTRLAFPKARIIATDLSEAYLREASRQLGRYPRTEFLQAAGERLPFRDAEFDAVYSVFLFHELPEETREEVLRESQRVLKPGGFFGLVDSLQAGDQPALEPLLRDFPDDFHEPYYRNYLDHPMEALAARVGFEDVRTDTGFFSKMCSARKAWDESK